MTGKTTIEWTDQPGYVGAVWNPTTGCTRVSDGCDNCYAFALHDKRYKSNLDHAHAHGEKSAAFMRMVLESSSFSIDADQRLPWPAQYDRPFSTVQLLPERLDAPLRTRKPTCYFVDSMSDLFHEDVPDEFIDRVFATMWRAQQHRFLILTKRPERMAQFFKNVPPAAGAPNVWLGTSVEDQASADERIPHLLATPAAVRFLSCEPLLGPVDLTSIPCEHDGEPLNPLGSRIHWVIGGGESGPRARPMDLAWARSLVAQCRAAGVAPFVKQLGSYPIRSWDTWPSDTEGNPVAEPATSDHGQRWRYRLREPHGRDMTQWPEDLRIREFPR